MQATLLMMPLLYSLLVVGSAGFTLAMWRRASLYYNRHVWYTLAMVVQASIAITAVVAIFTELYWLTLTPAILFLIVTCKVKAASDDIITAEASKIKSLYNDVN